jgi:hypothetical protein
MVMGFTDAIDFALNGAKKDSIAASNFHRMGTQS